jgi:predicted RNA methylase
MNARWKAALGCSLLWPVPCTAGRMDSFPEEPEGADPASSCLASDPGFNLLLPGRERRAASRFWTPVAVARRAAHLLGEHGARTVLDVGAGPGKFCITAALHRPEMRWIGVEQRPRLVQVARSLIRRMGLANADVRVGDAVGVDWSEFDAFYFFNPFGENLFADEAERLDSSVELSRRRFMADSSLVEQALQRAPLGTVVVTYYGFGGRIPGAFTPMHREAAGTDWLRVWVRTEPRSMEETWLELPDGTATLGRWLAVRSCAQDP